jgi:hypothetical protein
MNHNVKPEKLGIGIIDPKEPEIINRAGSAEK